MTGTTVLIGTAETLPTLLAVPAAATDLPQLVGACVLIGSGNLPPLPRGSAVYRDWQAFLPQAASLAPAIVLISLPLHRKEEIEQLTAAMDRQGIVWRFLPTLADQLAGCFTPELLKQAGGVSTRVEAPSARNGGKAGTERPLWSIDPETVLDRHPQPLDMEAIRGLLTGRVVLLTGAGGSIGSELARMVCRYEPSRIVLVERSENALFEIDRDIARRFPRQVRSLALHDVTDASKTLALLMAHKPHVIFHAAAHKHVPMMEEHPSAAVENNFYGTRSIADAACKVGVDRFVMISSDKAVRPSSIMGATKRLAELYVQYLTDRCETVFSMVRFGNVLGSACSVLPIWSEQISRGGPVTVTHPDMTRYFMTIPEAAGLVIQSAAFAGRAGGGEVFLLDMGKPIRIVELARRFIRHHGMEPDRDIRVEFTGIRPGEKLFEELAYESEEMIPTPHPSVRIWKTVHPDAKRMQQVIAAFDRLRGQADGKGRHYWQDVTKGDILEALRAAVPEMVEPAVPREQPAVTLTVNSTRKPPLAAAG